MSDKELITQEQTQPNPKNEVAPNLGGRPRTYVDISDIAREICDVISRSNQSILRLCALHAHWPSHDTIHRWINENYQGFADQYARAKENQADFLVDNMLFIIDKPETYTDEQGNVRNDVAMMRLKTDVYKWQAGKLRPKKYGDRQQVDNTLTITHEQSIKELE